MRIDRYITSTARMLRGIHRNSLEDTQHEARKKKQNVEESAKRCPSLFKIIKNITSKKKPRKTKKDNKGHYDYHTDAARPRAIALSQICALLRLSAAAPLPLVSVVVELPLPVVELPAAVVVMTFVAAVGGVVILVNVGVVRATAVVGGGTGAADVVTFVPVVVPNEGAATALLGSTRAPTPQGIGSPESGWAALAGGVVGAPVSDAMVKRPVHVMLGLWGAVNW